MKSMRHDFVNETLDMGGGEENIRSNLLTL